MAILGFLVMIVAGFVFCHSIEYIFPRFIQFLQPKSRMGKWFAEQLYIFTIGVPVLAGALEMADRLGCERIYRYAGAFAGAIVSILIKKIPPEKADAQSEIIAFGDISQAYTTINVSRHLHGGAKEIPECQCFPKRC